jgi:hypothetical protein
VPLEVCSPGRCVDDASDDRTLYVSIPMLEFERLMTVERAARNLDEHSNAGYAKLVSYLIRLHEALEGARV